MDGAGVDVQALLWLIHGSGVALVDPR